MRKKEIRNMQWYPRSTVAVVVVCRFVSRGVCLEVKLEAEELMITWIA